MGQQLSTVGDGLLFGCPLLPLEEEDLPLAGFVSPETSKDQWVLAIVVRVFDGCTVIEKHLNGVVLALCSSDVQGCATIWSFVMYICSWNSEEQMLCQFSEHQQ